MHMVLLLWSAFSLQMDLFKHCSYYLLYLYSWGHGCFKEKSSVSVVIINQLIYCVHCTTAADGAKQQLQEMNDVVDEIVHLSFPTKQRIELGKHLGIPSKTLHMIEEKAITNNSHSKKSILTEMVKYWFERDKSASLAAMMDILENKMGMRLYEYEDRVTKGVVSQLGSCVKKTDIEQILTQLTTYLPELVASLVTERSTGNNRTKMRRFLKSWIMCKKEDATWIALIGRIEKINEEAARKIKAMRCPAQVKQSTAKTEEQEPSTDTVIMVHTCSTHV